MKVTLQDSSPPAAVRKRFFTASFAACGCKARSKMNMWAAEGGQASK